MSKTVVLLTTTRQFDLLRADMLQQLILTSLFTILTGIGAFIAIPLSFSPVPITFQTLFVLLSGYILGRYYAPLSQFLYVFLGILGVPWFSGGKFGLTVVLGSTGGYLLGFIISAFLIGWITDISKQTRTPLALFTSAVTGTIIIYLFGIIGLLNYFPLWTSIEYGLFPFIPGDVFKIIITFGLLYLFFPSQDQIFETGMTNTKNNIWNVILIIISLGTFTVFFAYLYSNGNNIPVYLPIISLFSTFCLIPCLLVFVRNLKSRTTV